MRSTFARLDQINLIKVRMQEWLGSTPGFHSEIGTWLGSTPGFHSEIGTLWGTNNLGWIELYGSEVEPYIVKKISGMCGEEYWKIPVVIKDAMTNVDQWQYKVHYRRTTASSSAPQRASSSTGWQ